MNAREGIQSCKSQGIQSVRWFLDFMPSYMDVSTGISTIPILHLGRIEREWLLTAEHGGTGGLLIRSGMVLEAPDTDLLVLTRSSSQFLPNCLTPPRSIDTIT